MTPRNRLIVVLTIALLLPLVFVGPAVGGPDCTNPKFVDHPHCDADPGPLPDHPDGATCEAWDETWIAATDEFEVTMQDRDLCVDWTTTRDAAWRLIVEANGAKSVLATVRDSHPGDFCWSSDGISGSVVTPILAMAAVDACGTEYTDLADSPADAVPYVLTLGYKGKSSGVVVTVEEVASTP